MNKVDLVDAVYRVHGGLSRREAAELVDVILDSVKLVLSRETRLQLSGFGSFQVVPRRARRGRNPHTGEAMRLAPRRALVFKPSRRLLERLNESASDRRRGSRS